MAKPKLSIIISVRETKAEHRDVIRLGNCLDSLDAQTVAGSFEVIISDTDSDLTYRRKHEAIAKEHKAKYVFTKTGKPWCISRARNVGIRAARADYVMSTDADCIFAPNFVETIFKHLDEGNIIHCRIGDIPQNYDGPLDDWSGLKSVSSLRPNWCYGGCQVVSRKWAESVHGYDEAFILWGAEDSDFMERAVIAGKKNVWIEDETSYFHQWHSRANRDANPEQKAKNRARLKLTEQKLLPLIRNPHEWGGKPEPDEWDDTAVIVTTFLRDDSLLRTIQLIRKFYPTIDIIVADNGHPTPEKTEWLETYDCKHVTVPFDSGVTVARNAGVKILGERHRYTVIVEDDIGFTGATDLAKWRTVLDEEPTVGAVGGLLHVVTDYAGEYEQHYEARIEINAKDKTAYVRRIDAPEWREKGGVKYELTDLILNVFMARRATLEEHPWDENIKSAPEHCDWFFGLKYKTAWKVAYAPDVMLAHFKERAYELNEDYKSYRKRPGSFKYFAKKWGVDYYWNSWHPAWGIDNPQPLNTFAEISTQTRRNVFSSAARILDLMGVKWWIEAGTCLGAIREKNFIGHDQDIDVGIWAERPRDIARDLTGRMKAADFRLIHEFEHAGQLFELSFLKAEVKIDVFFFFERNGLAWHGAFGPDNGNGTGNYNVFLPHIFTLGLFKELREIDFVGLRVKTPRPVEQYLTERYGPDWRTPKKDYYYWTDCKAVARKFDAPGSATVYIGGVWDVFHHGHLNILERSKALGARLIVGVLTNDAAAAYKARPQIPEAERLRIIKALRIVDEAILQHHQDPTSDLRAAGLEPDYLVHGDDWDHVPGGEYVLEHGGRTVILPYTEGVSSTLIRLGGEVKRLPGKGAAGAADYAVCIKTFMREATLYRTIAAFQKNISEPFRFYIADDSGKKSDRKLALYQDLRKRGAEILDRPFDSGLSAGRNALVKAAKEPFIFLTDDDIALNDNDALLRMRAVLDARPDIGLVAALVSHEGGAEFASPGYARGLRLERIGGMLKRTPMQGEYQKAPMLDGGEALYLEAQQVPNCFLARRELFDNLKWDERIRIEHEHLDFFLAMNKAATWKAAVAAEALATHFRSLPDLEYERHRRNSPVAYFMSKWSLANIINQF